MEKGREQVITRFTKQGGKIMEDSLEVCDFVPILDGVVR
jgi:protein-L-isoaspartate(D-aspartate) O-methyltransferase